MSCKTISNKIMFSFVHLQPIRWIRPTLAFAFLVVLMSVPILAQTFVTDKDEVIVPEGGTATFQVKLSGEPSSDVSVTVTRESGDTDITVLSGSSLTFAPNKWNKYQTVTLAAAEDDDVIDGEATIRISAPGIEDKEITAIEDDDDELSFEVKKEPVTVLEGDEGFLEVKLSGEPSSDVSVTVTRESGDTDITVKPGSEQLTFTTSDWKKYQTVTLEAAEDDDVIDGEATIRISAPGIEDKEITAVEDDNDIADISLKLNPRTGTTGNIIKISIDISKNTLPITSFGLDFIYDYNLFTLNQ